MAQWRTDALRLWRAHRISFTISSVVLVAGILLCVLLPPEPHDHCVVFIEPEDVTDWAVSKKSRGADLANARCEGGRAVSLELWTDEYTRDNATSEFVRESKAQSWENLTKCDDDQAIPTLPTFVLSCQEPRLSRRAFVTLAITTVTLVAMMKDLPPDMCMLAATTFLLLYPWEDGEGIITESEAWQGFSNEGVLTVGVLFMVARAIDATGIVEVMMRVLLGTPSSLFVALLRLLIPMMIMGAFLNNTPIVAMLIPVVSAWATRIDQPRSRFMMPLSFGAMLSGMLSMMGTSTNLVVAGLLAKNNPEEKPFGLFDIAVLGAPCAAVGILYMAITARWLLPNRNADPRAKDAAMRKVPSFDGGPVAVGGYELAFRVMGADLIGKSVEASGMIRLEGASVLRVLRPQGAEEAEDAPSRGTASSPDRAASYTPLAALDSPTTLLARGDVVVLHVVSAYVAAHVRRCMPGMEITSPAVRLLGRRRHRRHLVEVVLARNSPLLGQPIRDLGPAMLDHYEVAAIAVRPQVQAHALATPSGGPTLNLQTGTTPLMASDSPAAAAAAPCHAQPPLESTAPLRAGDVVLAEALPSFVQVYRQRATDFILIKEVQSSQPPRVGSPMDNARRVVAAVGMIIMVICASTKTTSLLVAAILLTAVLLAMKTLTLGDALNAVKARVLLAIVFTFGVGEAMQKTGAAHWIAQGLISVFGGLGPIGALLSVALVTSVVGCVVSNNATVILMYPICNTLAQTPAYAENGITLRLLLLVLMVGASSSFLTPVSYQTNLMVLEPGGYQFLDYARFGFGLQLLMVVASVGVAQFLANVGYNA